eukprot:1972502-Pleurochrysis_carterae.AAC.1
MRPTSLRVPRRMECTCGDGILSQPTFRANCRRGTWSSATHRQGTRPTAPTVGHESAEPIYGMAQAGRRWQRSLFPWLREWGFKQCESDPCVFVAEELVDGSRQRVVLGCYVDD